MAQYIDKSALVAEINRLHEQHSCKYGCDEVAINLEYLEDFIDTLEVKEVDLEHEIEKVKKMQRNFELKNDTIVEFCSKHFFELGLNTKKENNYDYRRL